MAVFEAQEFFEFLDALLSLAGQVVGGFFSAQGNGGEGRRKGIGKTEQVVGGYVETAGQFGYYRGMGDAAAFPLRDSGLAHVESGADVFLDKAALKPKMAESFAELNGKIVFIHYISPLLSWYHIL